MRRITILGGVAFTTLLLSCTDEVVVVVPVATVEVSGPSSLVAGSTAQFSATPRDDRGNALANRSISWSTSDGSYASVSSDGTVTGVLGGQVSISAASEGVSGNSMLQVINPVPIVSGTDPSVVLAGVGEFQLTVRGSGFVSASLVRLNGVNQPTTHVSAEELRASISGGDIGAPGEEVQISVHNPQPGGGSSGNEPLPVGFPVPTITDVSPDHFTMGPRVGAVLNLTVTGLYPASEVRWDGESRPFRDLAPGQIQVLLSMFDLEAPGWKTVTVTNPSPGGGTSEPESIAVRIPLAGPFLAAGGSHTCALDRSGQAYCWGRNDSGQLGDGSLDDSVEPQSVLPPALPTGSSSESVIGPARAPVAGSRTLVALTTGAAHTCGLDEVGQALCWGNGQFGQLGDGSGQDHPEPVQVSGGLNFVSLQAGYYHTCGLTYEGRVHCWGANDYGQLGDGSGFSQGAPVPVQQGSLVFEALGVGGLHTCGVTDTGSVHCWGDNRAGQLGDGTDVQRNLPTLVPGLPTVAEITLGTTHTCTWSGSGAAFCWGSNESGKLGNGSGSSSMVPVPVSGGLDFDMVRAGLRHTCGITKSGEVFCWGSGDHGELGTPETFRGSSSVPVHLLGLPMASGIAVGYSHSCALLENGQLFCWGEEGYGQLGNGQISYRSSPARVVGGPPAFGLISSGVYHTCGLASTGKAYCWGGGLSGQRGDGIYSISSSEPVEVSTGELFAALTSGSLHTCGLNGLGKAYCWGSGTYGQLGSGSFANKATPVPVAGNHTFKNLQAGDFHTCGATIGGTILCWGWNQSGQLGTGSTQNAAQPLTVTTQGDQSFTMVGAGRSHSCGRTTTGEVWCWGDNSAGQLGDGSLESRLTPVKVTNLPPGIAWVRAGRHHTCALDASGNALCWGYDAHGELGRGTYSNYRATPEDVAGGHLFRSIYPNGGGTCAITVLNQGYCWGAGANGQLGSGELVWAYEPVPIAGDYSWATISDGSGSHHCGVTISGAGYCWGWQSIGELGIGTTGTQPVPVPVNGLLDFGQPALPMPGRR